MRTAADAETALREFPLFQPEAVVLDVSLPDSNGMDVCQAIRAESKVPVLFVTGRGTLQDKTRGFRAGGDDYLVKPFLPSELALRVEALLRRSAWSAPPAARRDRVGDLEVDGQARTVRLAGDDVSGLADGDRHPGRAGLDARRRPGRRSGWSGGSACRSTRRPRRPS